LRNLTNLWLDHNQLTSIPPEIGQLRNLTELSLGNNQLSSIPPEIGQLRNLTNLWLDHNQLTSIPPEIGQLTNLTALLFGINRLTSIPPEIGQLINLTNLRLDNNPIENIPLNVARLLNRQRTTSPGVYADTQSVHNSNIQATLKKSIMRLLKEPTPEKDVIPLILSDITLSPFTKESLIEYAREESVHMELNLSFSDLLILVWNRIMVSPHSEEIKAVLNTEMRDAECKCFTGRISRLVNCLNGFDPFVVVQISDNEQIGTVISLIKTQLEEKNDYTVERHKEETSKRLLELGVEEGEIEVWLSYIEE
jgi:Leucine-rich repeat (LRR) protein